MNVHSIYRLIFKFTRRKRMELFMKAMCPQDGASVLDIGGTAYNWKYIDKKLDVTLLNLALPKDSNTYPANFKCVIGNGVKLDYPDNAFDIVFCNSVIEHVVPKNRWLFTPKEYIVIRK